MITLTKSESNILLVDLTMICLSVFSVVMVLIFPNIFTGVFTILLIVIGIFYHFIVALPLHKRIAHIQYELMLSDRLKNYKGGDD